MNPTEAYRPASADPDGSGSGPEDSRVLRAVEEYLAALEGGRPPGRDEFLARHVAIAGRLGDYLDGLELIHRAGSAAGPAAGPGGDVLPLAEPAPGVLGDFRIVREVGRGGMGVVYEAEQISLGRRVALKVLPFAATLDPRQLQRFHNEARAAASLDHPHIVHVHAVGCERGVHYYAMQFIEGQTLAGMIAQLRRAGGRPAPTEEQPTTPHVPGQPAPPSAETAPRAAASTERTRPDRAHYRRVAEWGIQAAEALDHAHQLGIVHRDVKPANLLVDGRGGLWVTDFGLAHIQSDARLTMTGDLVGTLRYMSPEQALAKRVVIDHRTDVYSLGATLYELLTLESAFTGNDRQELLRQIAFEEPKRPRRVNRAIPAELETIALKAMEKNPAERYASAKELADDLRRWLGDEPIRARPAGVARRLRKWGRRHPAWVAAAAAALLAAVVVLSAAVGWVGNDRATRAQRTTDEIRTALKESAEWQRRRRVPQALAAARRAQAALAGGHADPALSRQVEARVSDLELLARLEEARLEGALIRGNDSGLARAERRYGEIFRESHLDVDVWPAEEAGRYARDSTIPLELAALLDDWAMVRRFLHPPGKAQWKHLLEVARAADPDVGRTRLRDALAGTDSDVLAKLASSEAARLSPWTLNAVARFLVRSGAHQAAAGVLRQAQRRHPDDFWFNFDLGVYFVKARPPRHEEAIPLFMVAVALRPESAIAHVNLGTLLGGKRDLDGAIAAFRQAIDLDPKCALAHLNLGNALYLKKDLDGAIAEYRKAIDLDPQDADFHNNLGNVLDAKGDLDGAIAEYRQAIDLDPKDAAAHNNLGTALYLKKDLDAAIAECRKAIDLDRSYAFPHNTIGNALRDQGDTDGAIAAYRTAIKLDPRYANPHNGLGNVLHDKGDLEGAIVAHRKAIELDPKDANLHTGLGGALRDKGDVDGAIAELRQAIELDPKDAYAHNNLGAGLRDQGDLDGAIAAYRKAVELEYNFPEAHYNLGQCLCDQGRFTEALTSLRRAHELGSKDPRWPHPSAQWVKECERLVELDGKLPAILGGKEQPANTAERAEYAAVCQKKHLYAGAARLYREAIAAQPDLVASPDNGIRYNGACAAALAGCRAGKDVAQLTDAERAGLRKQALDWLRADLDAWRGLLDKELDKARPAVSQQMRHWLRDTDFNGVRGPDALAKLPEAERPAWQQFWGDVQRLLDRTAATPTPTSTEKP